MLPPAFTPPVAAPAAVLPAAAVMPAWLLDAPPAPLVVTEPPEPVGVFWSDPELPQAANRGKSGTLSATQ